MIEEENLSNIIREMIENLNKNNVSNEMLFTQKSNGRLYRALEQDIEKEDRLHRKDDVEAKKMLKLGDFFLKYSDNRPSDCNLAIDCFSKAIVIAKSDSLLFLAYYRRAKVFLNKSLYHNSFYDSNHYLENVPTKNEMKMKEMSQCYIESCIKISEWNLNKAYTKSIDKKIKLLKMAGEFLDRARVEAAIQMLCFENNTFLNKINMLENIIETTDLSKFHYDSYKHSNVYNILDNQNYYKGEYSSRGKKILFEKPWTFLVTKSLRYCGWCATWIGYKFIPCTGCDEVIFCNLYCRKLAEEFGGHLKICRYHFRVARILGVKAYLVYIDSSRIKKINYKFKYNYKQMNNDDIYIENLIRVQALILAFIIQKKIYNETLNFNFPYFHYCLNELRNYYESPFLKKRLTERFVEKREQIDNQMEQQDDISMKTYIVEVKKRFNILGHGLIEYILDCSPNGNVDRYFKSGNIVYKASFEFIKDQTKVILKT